VGAASHPDDGNYSVQDLKHDAEIRQRIRGPPRQTIPSPHALAARFASITRAEDTRLHLIGTSQTLGSN
jgi:hypothetical protein